MQSDELSLRAGQLGSANTRERLSRALRVTVAAARSQPGPVARLTGACDIQAADALLLQLAERVDGDEALGVEGLAKTWLMVHDDPSVLYHREAGPPVAEAVVDALWALDRGHRTAGIPAT